MPFSAILDGERVLSVLMDDARWDDARLAAKSKSLIMAYSGLPCFPKTSSAGLRFFSHYPGARPDIEWQETQEHMLIKSLILQGARDTGWLARTEVPSRDRSWIADTLLTKGGKHVAVEVQWSRQSVEDYRRRTERYRRYGVYCIWLVRKTDHLQDVPQSKLLWFPVQVNMSDRSASIDGHSVDEFIRSVITKSHRHVATMYVWDHQCHACGGMYWVWVRYPSPYLDMLVDHPDRNSEMSQQVHSHVPSNVAVRMPMFRRVHPRGLRQPYTAFSCPSCRAFCGESYIDMEYDQRPAREMICFDVDAVDEGATVKVNHRLGGTTVTWNPQRWRDSMVARASDLF